MLSILEKFGVAPNHAMLVGDSDVDVKTARNSGAWACGVTYGFGTESLKEFPPDILLDSLAELPAYLDMPGENTV
jgi:phosphoglycolate phosphatase